MIFTYLATAFGAGFLASLSPCVYPMLPITLGFLTRQTSQQEMSNFKKKTQVIAFFLGQVITFTLLGLIAVKLGEIFGFSSQSGTVNIVVGSLLFAMALISVSSRFQELFAKFNSMIPGSGRATSPSIFTGFIFGASSALVASPCTSPVLGGVLGQISSQGSFVGGILQMIAFASGMGLIFLLLGLGLLNVNKIPRSGNWMNYMHRLTTVILFIGAGYYFWLAFGV